MLEPLQLFICRVATPIGRMMLVCDKAGRLRLAFFAEDEELVRRQLVRQFDRDGFLLEAARNPFGLSDAFARYFAGELGVLDSLAVETGGTPFQRQVWQALREIPCGSTVSYGQLAERIGRPTAVRAVGLANGTNPVSVVVPCHRVIGSNGSLTGYGGGLERKRWLLNHERTPTLF
jgi:methylated-DNA-[protein]-cysteine S-methyltransferase